MRRPLRAAALLAVAALVAVGLVAAPGVPAPRAAAADGLQLGVYPPSPQADGVRVTLVVTTDATNGVVTFLDGTTPLGTGVLSASTASLSGAALAVGTHQLSARLDPGGLTSPTIPYTVAPASVTLTASPPRGQTPGGTVTLSAMVSAPTGGVVEFIAAGKVVATAAVTNGTATAPLSSLTAGLYTFSASFRPSAGTPAIVSTPLDYAVATPRDTTTFLNPVAPPLVGRAFVTLSAGVLDAGSPASVVPVRGRVELFQGARSLGSAPVQPGGGVTLAVPRGLDAGDSQLKAVFTPVDDSFRPSSSPTLAVSVQPAIPRTATLPQILGRPRVGTVARCSGGTWFDGHTFSYLWLRDGRPLYTGTDTSRRGYTIDDLGHTITCRVVVANISGVTSADSPPVRVGRGPALRTGPGPRILGTPRVGSRLTAQTGRWGPLVKSFRYQWRANGTSIAGQRGATFVVRPSDRGDTITVVVTAKHPAYDDGRASSQPVTVLR